MRGAQENVLPSPIWDGFNNLRPYEYSTLVASTFARYPYPESFFVWQPDLGASGMVFFNRSDRLPHWDRRDRNFAENRFPAVVGSDALVSERLLGPILADAQENRRYAAFELDIGNVKYQVVAEIIYSDEFREHVTQVVGFTVSLPWVRNHYFGELTQQVAEIGGEDARELSLAVFDDAGNVVVGAVSCD